ncbi:uncharacterized protein B0I36DRAFT_355423 [Microdochium trichocladiopsis]|uniref:C2H2-type domain-containing protein n=1 Tax=Microdochium trichocladiopsis TaxID=1682393 RepID=A0A9P8XS20_9PEZI|nr:uncharacterized protein B0I36DRAFT_355423 [Microdochium trichocladiopsis]KAH7014170.1 hypothetical protein B0I36DRAFT_355423 [Microdochium trichocladiopsis]
MAHTCQSCGKAFKSPVSLRQHAESTGHHSAAGVANSAGTDNDTPSMSSSSALTPGSEEDGLASTLSGLRLDSHVEDDIEIDMPLDRFFRSFDAFKKYDPSTPPSVSFSQLRNHLTSTLGYHEMEALRKRFHRAIDMELEEHYGRHNDLAAWQELCRVVVASGAGETGKSITGCKKILQAVNINIFDLVHFARRSLVHRTSPEAAAQPLSSIKTFASVKALKTYSKKQSKVFPLAGGARVNGDQSAALKAFLRPFNR